jgi:hypothetical protein
MFEDWSKSFAWSRIRRATQVFAQRLQPWNRPSAAKVALDLDRHSAQTGESSREPKRVE